MSTVLKSLLFVAAAAFPGLTADAQSGTSEMCILESIPSSDPQLRLHGAPIVRLKWQSLQADGEMLYPQVNEASSDERISIGSDAAATTHVPISIGDLCLEVLRGDWQLSNTAIVVEPFLDGRSIGLFQGITTQSPVGATGGTILELPLEPIVVPCPPPGKHVIQVRYLLNGCWSALSKPIRLDVRFPLAPKIVSVANKGEHAGPIPERGTIVVTADEISVRFATMEPGMTVAAYLDGKRIEKSGDWGCGRGTSGCTGNFAIGNAVPPGRYSLTIRAFASQQPDSPASPPSEPVLIQYQPRAATVGQFQGINGCCHGYGSMPCPSCLDCPIEVRAAFAEPERNAFASLPTAERLEQAAGNVKIQSHNEGPEDPSNATLSLPQYEYRFFAPAHFPLRQFGPRGEVVDRDGVIIYEGMRFAVDQVGQYDVDFIAGIPAIPTILQLQFLVRVEEGNTRWRTVTLPPIVVDPKGQFPGSNESGVVKIHHTGYSVALNGLSCQGIQEIRRQGSARFGFGTIQ